MADFKLLTFDHGGISHELISLEDCEEAVEEGYLKPDTVLVAYYADGSVKKEVASECGFLEHLFVPSKPQADTVPEPVNDDVPENVKEVPSPWAQPKTSASNVKTDPQPTPKVKKKSPLPQAPTYVTISAASKGPDPVKPSPPVAVASEPEQTTEAGNTKLGCLILAAAGAAILFGISKCSSGKSDEAASAASNATASTTSGQASEDPSTWQTFYSVGAFNLRSVASVQGKLVANLPRATELVGVVVPGTDDPSTNWLLIKRGPYSGRYVSVVNLSSSAPPDLDASYAGEYYVLSDTMPLIAPESSSGPLSDERQKVKFGQRIKVNGTIGSYAEIGLNRGGVGYVEFSNLSSSPPEEVTAAGDGGSEGSTIRVSSRCPSTVSIGIYYYSGGGWRDNGGATWSWAPNQVSLPSYRESNLVASSPEIYVVFFGINGTSYPYGAGGNAQITYGAQRVSARKYNASLSSNGFYEINLC